MGVKISPLVDDVKKVITFENLIGKRIAIDGFNALYQFLAIIRGQDGEPLKDLQGNVTSHLSGIFNRIINLLEENVRPIFIFDGPPNEFKVARDSAPTCDSRKRPRKKWQSSRCTGFRGKP